MFNFGIREFILNKERKGGAVEFRDHSGAIIQRHADHVHSAWRIYRPLSSCTIIGSFVLTDPGGGPTHSLTDER